MLTAFPPRLGLSHRWATRGERGWPLQPSGTAPLPPQQSLGRLRGLGGFEAFVISFLLKVANLKCSKNSLSVLFLYLSSLRRGLFVCLVSFLSCPLAGFLARRTALHGSSLGQLPPHIPSFSQSMSRKLLREQRAVQQDPR